MGIGWQSPSFGREREQISNCFSPTPYLAIEVDDPSPNPATEVNKLLKYPSAPKKNSGPNFLDSHVTVSKPHVISAPDLCILPHISNMNHRSYSCCFNGHSESHYWEHEKCKTPCFFVLPDEREQAEIIVAEVRSVFDEPNRMALLSASRNHHQRSCILELAIPASSLCHV